MTKMTGLLTTDRSELLQDLQNFVGPGPVRDLEMFFGAGPVRSWSGSNRSV